MTDYSAERLLPGVESEPWGSRVYFTEPPGPEAYEPSFKELKDAIAERFRHGIQIEAWNDMAVCAVDCKPRELPAIAGLVEEMGFMVLLRSRQEITAYRLMCSDVDVLHLPGS